MENSDIEGQDVVFIGPPDDDGGNNVLRHYEDNSYGLGVIHPLQHGKQIYGEVIELKKRDGPGFKMKKIGISGPVMVNSKDYRSGWDTIFNKNITSRRYHGSN